MSDENGFVPIPSLVILEREASRKDGELGRFTEQVVGEGGLVRFGITRPRLRHGPQP